MRKLWLFMSFLLLALGMVGLSFCGERQGEDHSSKPSFRNLSDSAKYVGIQTCAQCHVDIYESFIQTGMGQSIDTLSPEKSALYGKQWPPIYDEHLDFFYQPKWKGKKLFIHEYRLNKGDTVYQRMEEVSYVIGSGQHTNSHLVNRNGYVYQMPLTCYTQTQRLDLPPGFENGYNSRFSRTIGLECMSCHNAYPKFALGSSNRFNEVPQGINCERCHGPGSIHVKEKLAGKLVDTSQGPDYSIVNPRRLTADLQFEICQRCHLQGNAVLQEGKSFFDFKPGMHLKEVMDVYVPQYEDDEQFIMASHVERFKSSSCYLQSNQNFNCISCHNPHLSVKMTDNKQFNLSCQSCHSGFEHQSLLEHNDCVSCHMSQSGSTDIPHVRVTDHKIQIPKKKQTVDPELRKFVQLYCVNNASPSQRSKALAHLQQYERFNSDWPELLDTAWKYIQGLAPEDEFHLGVYALYLANDFNGIVSRVATLGRDKTMAYLKGLSYDNFSAWTAYRIGQAYQSLARENEALAYFNRACELAPLDLKFAEKKAVILAKLGQLRAAKALYEWVLNEDAFRDEAWSNWAFVMQQLGDTQKAEEGYLQALELNPDYLKALENLSSLYLSLNQLKKALPIVDEMLRVKPEYAQALAVKSWIENELVQKK